MARAKVTFVPILPKGKFDEELYKAAWERAMREKVKPELITHFKNTVEGWEEKPVFRGTINKSTEYLRLLVKPVGSQADKYAMIDITGAKPHPIRAKNAPMLTFQPGYTASTTPRVLKSRRKRRSGRFISTPSVYHPGFEPREFSETIAETYQPRYEKVMQDATNRAVKEQKRHF